MKLYKIAAAPAGERWHSSKTGLKDVVEIELPKEGRQGMAQFLNVNEMEVSTSPTISAIYVPDGPPVDELEVAELRAVAAATRGPDERLTADAIVGFILNDATVAQAEAVFAAFGTRFKEHVDATR